MLTSVRGVSIGHNSLSFPELSTLSRDQTNRMPRQFPEVAVAGLPLRTSCASCQIFRNAPDVFLCTWTKLRHDIDMYSVLRLNDSQDIPR